MAKRYLGRHLQFSVGRLTASRRTAFIFRPWHVWVLVRGWFVAARWV